MSKTAKFVLSCFWNLFWENEDKRPKFGTHVELSILQNLIDHFFEFFHHCRDMTNQRQKTKPKKLKIPIKFVKIKNLTNAKKRPGILTLRMCCEKIVAIRQR
jgi:hypothetical protein